MNKIMLMGRLTRDPEVRYAGQDNSVCIARFSLAVDRRRRAGEAAETDFFNCTAFGKLGEFAERYLKKGTKIVLTGRMQQDNYTNREGQKVYSWQVIAEEIEFAESKAASQGTSQQGFAPVGGQQSAQSAPAYGQQAPTYSQPAPTYSQQPAQAAPVFEQPAQAAPVYEAAPAGSDFMNVPDSLDDSDLPFNS